MAGKRFLLCAGGTGGHLFPAEALADELTARGHEVHLATDKRAERFAGRFSPDAIHRIDSATIAGRNPIALARAGLLLWKGFRQSTQLIERIRPSAVVGFGGYPTLPPMLAAGRRGVPTLIHEQNAVMGRANKALAPRVTAIAGGFLPEGGPHADKTILTGNPVRQAVIEASSAAYEPATENGPFHLLVFGGSQGAQYFSNALPEAIALLPSHLRSRLEVVQQARADDEAQVNDAYRALGIEALVSPFFADMAQRIAHAHLVISRSGASTVSEIAAIGRPAILVPYPHALDHDQAANAAELERVGAAQIRPQSTLDARSLAELLEQAMTQPKMLAERAEAAREVGRPHAARLLADLAEAIASGQTVEEFRKGARP